MLLLGTLLAPSAPANDAGAHIMKHGVIHEDTYLAGSSVSVRARVEGDLVAAGGEVETTDTIQGDVLIAGATVHIGGVVNDDVRVAGGEVDITARIHDDLLSAGGSVRVSPDTTVGGRAWLAGGTVDTRATIGKGLKVGGGQIVVGGEIGGDAELMGDQIQILPGTRIHGNLTYWSPTAITLDKTVRVDGTVTHFDVEGEAPSVAARAGMRVGLLTTLTVAAIVYFLLFPLFSIDAAHTLRRAPWKSLGLGLAMLMTTPLVIVLLLLSLLGIWLGLALLALYCVLLLAGILTGILALADWGLRWRQMMEPDRRWRVGAIVIAMALLWLLGLIPGVAALLLFALLLFGTGALTLTLWRRYRPAA